MSTGLRPVDSDALDDYPFDEDDRMDAHWFMAWERRRWLNSDMRMNATPECRALYFDLINIAYDQSPIGTLPDNLDTLAKLVYTEPGHFRSLCRLDYGPLYRWRRMLCSDGRVRFGHPVVIKSLLDALARKENNRAMTDAANERKRVNRLRQSVAQIHKELAKQDMALSWMDKWLLDRGCQYRSAEWVEKAMRAWMDHTLDRNMGRASQQEIAR